MITPFFGWLALAVLFAVFEVGHPGLFFFLSFSCGAVLAAFVSLLPACLTSQLTAFFVGTIGAFLLFRHFVSRFVSATGQRTNVEALVGKQGVVLEVIKQNKPGRVRVGGEAWLARASNANMELAEGIQITVVAVRGAHVVVAPLDKRSA